MQLFQEARKEVFTNRLCRSAFCSTGIYPYNHEAVLKNLPELKPDENRISNSELISAVSSTATTSPPSASTASPTPQTPPPNRTIDLLPPAAPHNAIGVKRHAELLLQEFGSPNCQGVELESDSRERVQQLAKSAHMSMTREAIQIETNQQLRLLNRKKGKPSDSTGPGSRTEVDQ